MSNKERRGLWIAIAVVIIVVVVVAAVIFVAPLITPAADDSGGIFATRGIVENVVVNGGGDGPCQSTTIYFHDGRVVIFRGYINGLVIGYDYLFLWRPYTHCDGNLYELVEIKDA